MYIFDFMKKMACRDKAPAIIYLILNVSIISIMVHAVLGGMFTGSFAGSWSVSIDWILTTVSGLLLYAGSVAIALTPFGEWLLRVQNKCTGIIREDYRLRLQPLFDEVCNKARLADPSISKSVRLYMKEDASANAYAMGRETICVTSGLMKADDSVIKGVLAHEFGHLAHKDTNLILVISVGNLFITAAALVIRIIFAVAGFFIAFVGMMMGRDEGIQGVGMGSLMFLIPNAVISIFMWIWTKTGVLLMMSTSRNDEYAADAFAKDLGYGEALCTFLSLCSSAKGMGIFAALSSSHPETRDRITRLRSV